MKIIVFFSGVGTNLLSFLIKEKKLNYKIISTFTNNPHAGGIKIAQDFDKPCKILDHTQYKSRELHDKEIQYFLSHIDFDYIVLAGYMRILSKFLVEEYEGRIINIHPSLLPKYPGLNTHQKVLDADDKYHGTTIHFVTHELDSGPIITQQRFKIEPNDTLDSLKDKVKIIENDLYPKTISELLR